MGYRLGPWGIAGGALCGFVTGGWEDGDLERLWNNLEDAVQDNYDYHHPKSAVPDKCAVCDDEFRPGEAGHFHNPDKYPNNNWRRMPK